MPLAGHYTVVRLPAHGPLPRQGAAAGAGAAGVRWPAQSPGRTAQSRAEAEVAPLQLGKDPDDVARLHPGDVEGGVDVPLRLEGKSLLEGVLVAEGEDVCRPLEVHAGWWSRCRRAPCRAPR